MNFWLSGSRQTEWILLIAKRPNSILTSHEELGGFKNCKYGSNLPLVYDSVYYINLRFIHIIIFIILVFVYFVNCKWEIKKNEIPWTFVFLQFFVK